MSDFHIADAEALLLPWFDYGLARDIDAGQEGHMAEDTPLEVDVDTGEGEEVPLEANVGAGEVIDDPPLPPAEHTGQLMPNALTFTGVEHIVDNMTK